MGGTGLNWRRRPPFFGIDEYDSTTSTDEVISNGKKPSELQEDELLTCCPTVPGFSFSDRLWRKLSVPLKSA